jgi:hypothetical protein
MVVQLEVYRDQGRYRGYAGRRSLALKAAGLRPAGRRAPGPAHLRPWPLALAAAAAGSESESDSAESESEPTPAGLTGTGRPGPWQNGSSFH